MSIEISYTVTQTAGILGCSAKTVRKLITSGRLKANHIGDGTKRKTFTVPPDAIVEFRKEDSSARIQQVNAIAYAVARQGRRWGESRFVRKAVPSRDR